jgi:hypothetical protein
MITKTTGMKKCTISNKHSLLELISQDGLNLRYACSTLKKDRDVVLAAVTQQGAAMQFADKTLQSDKQIVAAALQDNAEASIAYVDKKLLRDTTFILEILCGDFYAYMHDNKNIRTYFNTKTTVELLLSEYPDFFGDMEEEYKNNAALFVDCINKYDEKYGYGEGFLEDYGTCFSDNEDVMKVCYQLFPIETFAMLSKRLKHSESYILELLSIHVDKVIFDLIPNELKLKNEFLLCAVHENIKFFHFIDSKYHTDVVFLQDCLYKNPYLIEHFNEEDILPYYSKFREEVLDRLLVLYMVATEGILLQEVSEFNSDEEVIFIALRNNGLAIEFADERLKRNIRIIKWAMKENPQAIWKADEFMHDHPDLR